MFTHDFIMNGQAHGEVSETLASVRYDPGLMRPYWAPDKKGRMRRFVDVATGRSARNPETGAIIVNKLTGQPEPEVIRELAENTECPIVNATTLRKDDWIQLDRQAHKAYRQRLRLWTDITSQAGTYSGFDGMSKLILEHETMSDPGSALIDMDGVAEVQDDAPLFQLEGLPLPVIQSGWKMTARRRAVGMNSNTPLSTIQAETCGRRGAETLEQLALGTLTGPSWGVAADYSRTPQVYGLTNFAPRITSVGLTTPTGSNSATTLAEVLEMRQAAYDAKIYGPFVLYHSAGWDQFLDDDHFRYVTQGGAAPVQTLRQRLQNIEGITAVRRLDYFTTNYQMILVQMTSDVVRGVIGMAPKIIQWESRGGQMIHFKWMTIQVPQLFADYNDVCGIVHAST